jgi:hypothetical protein
LADDFVNPVDQVEASMPVEGRGSMSPAGPGQPATVTGRVIAVHRRTLKHAESHGRLDASVGEQSHSELVIQIDEGDVGDLVGKRVAIHYRAD